MNPFLIIILVALFVEFTLHVVSELLNLKALKPEPPVELEGIYKPDEYRNSQEYTRVNTRSGGGLSLFDHVVEVKKT